MRRKTGTRNTATARPSAPSSRATDNVTTSKRKVTIRRRKSEPKEVQPDERTARLLDELPTLAQSVRKDAAAAARIDAELASLEGVYALERERDGASTPMLAVSRD